MIGFKRALSAGAMAVCVTAPAMAQAQAEISVAQLPPARPAGAPTASVPHAPARTVPAVKPAALKPARMAVATANTTTARSPKTFSPATAPRWIVAATTTAAPIAATAPPPPKHWKPEKRWAVSPVIGTDGAGGELSYEATRNLVLRGRYTWLGIRHNQTYEQVRYGGRLKFATGGVFVDVHPLSSGWMHPFMLTAGMMKGQRRLSVLATPRVGITYNGHLYTPAQVGTITGTVQAPDTAPFVGLGWDNTFDSQGAFGFKVIAGTTIAGRPDVTLDSTGGTASMNALLQADLEAERGRIKDATDYLRFYPVISTGLTFKF